MAYAYLASYPSNYNFYAGKIVRSKHVIIIATLSVNNGV